MTGTRVIVTGAAGGVGKATVQRLLALGARVCATDIDPAVGDLARDGAVISIAADLTRAAEVDRIFRLAEDAVGGVDFVVSNAATSVTKSSLDTGEEEWDRDPLMARFHLSRRKPGASVRKIVQPRLRWEDPLAKLATLRRVASADTVRASTRCHSPRGPGAASTI